MMETVAPGARPATDTPGATQKVRTRSRSQRPNWSQVAIVPVIENRRGWEAVRAGMEQIQAILTR